MALITAIRKHTSLLALTAVAASAGLAGAASAATIGTPAMLTPGAKIPIDFAGYKEPANDRLPANHRIVRVPVEVARGERASTVLTSPKGFRAVTIGLGDGHQIGAVVNDRNYPGKRSVRVKLFVNTNKVAKGETGKGTLYLLARRA
jgi:hypothetical protein